MTRVLVVGSDTREEHELLCRLRQAANLPMDALSPSKDLDECDLIIVKDTPALRNAAKRMLSVRPTLQLWVADQHGVLRDGTVEHAMPLDDLTIESRLSLLPATRRFIDAPPLAIGRRQITQLLRNRLQNREGRLLLSIHGQPCLLADFETDQAVVQAVPKDPQLSVEAYLGELFDQLMVQELTVEQYQMLSDGRARQPLRPLFWQIAKHGSHWDELDKRLEENERVRIVRWPDFRVLGNQHDGFRISSLLLRKPCSVNECGQLLDVEPASVRSFVYSAYLCGYAVLEPALSTSVKVTVGNNVNSTGGSLLARMWRSVRRKVGEH